MSDRRVPPYQNYSSQWGGQQYPSPSNYSFQHGIHDVDVPHHQPVYGGMASPQNEMPYQEDYYMTSPSSYQHPSTNPIQPTGYHSANSVTTMREPHSPHRSAHYHSHSQSQTHGHSPYSLPPQQAQAQYDPGRPRSHSQSPYTRPQAVPIAIPQAAPHYPQPQAISISPQYPASPTRPFTCDLCALSFNRQHDLKRHRETHTGDKPYLCNGGCGKTFTRKDALKRHQLVKQCGKVDEAWP